MKRTAISHQAGNTLPRLMALVALAIGLALLIAAGYLAWSSLQGRIAIEQAGRDARGEAAKLGQHIESIHSALTSEAFANTAAEVDRGEADRSALIAALREQGVRNVLNLVIAREGIETVELDAFPGSGFAALEMLLQARAEGEVPAQVHFAGTPDEYLAFARRLPSDSEPVPVVLATFPVSVLANQIELPGSVAGMRLLQQSGEGETLIEDFGTASGANLGSVTIDNSLFRLAWYRPMPIEPVGMRTLAGVIGIGLLCIALAILVLRRTGRGRPAEAGETLAEEAEPGPEPEPEEPDIPVPSEPARAEPQPETVVEPPADAAEEAPDDDGSDQEAPLTPDGESRRSSVEQRSFEAPELGGDQAGRAEPADDGGSADEEDELLFDPDAPADDQSEISQMLKSLVEEEEDETAEELEQAGDDDVAPAPDTAGEAEPARPEIVVPEASIFRAYDIRGIVGKTLGPSVAESIGLAVGSEARSRGLTRIAVARDGRLSGAELLASLSRGLVATGLEVIDVGAVPTPVLYYAAQEVGGGSGVMVTGSHNPPDYNGFKIVLGGETLSGDAIAALRARLEAGDIEHGSGQLREQRIVVQYVERVGTDIQLEKPLKVVADCGNGIAGSIAPRLLEAIGAEVIPLYAEVDGTFPNHHPDPGDPTTLEDLKLCVRNFNADIGVAFDGDGDRLGVVAPDGEIIYPDRLMMLFARDVLSRVPGAPIIFDVKCSGLLAGEIEKAGGRPVMARTGHSFIKEQLKREQAPLAGEMSGHFFFSERWLGFDDGMYAAARLLEILAADTRSAGQILAELPAAESTPELKVEMKEGEPPAFVEAFREAAAFEDAEISTIDGVRADFPDGFGLLRSSNTTPVLVLRFEGTDKKALARIQQRFREVMLDIDPSLELPF